MKAVGLRSFEIFFWSGQDYNGTVQGVGSGAGNSLSLQQVWDDPSQAHAVPPHQMQEGKYSLMEKNIWFYFLKQRFVCSFSFGIRIRIDGGYVQRPKN